MGLVFLYFYSLSCLRFAYSVGGVIFRGSEATGFAPLLHLGGRDVTVEASAFQWLSCFAEGLRAGVTDRMYLGPFCAGCLQPRPLSDCDFGHRRSAAAGAYQ